MNEIYPEFVIQPQIELIPAATLRYADWDQFVLMDAVGATVSTTTGRRCDPFNRNNQQSMVDVLHAMGPWHKLGFVLSKADPFFRIKVTVFDRELPTAETAIGDFSECRVWESSTGDTLISGASFNIPDQTEDFLMPGLELYTHDLVLDLPTDSTTLTHPFIPTVFERW